MREIVSPLSGFHSPFGTRAGGGVAPPEDLSTVYSFDFNDQVSSVALRTYAGWTSTDDGNAARDLLRANTQQITRTGSNFTQPPNAIVHINQNLTGNVSFSFRAKTGQTGGEVVLGGTDRSNYVFASIASRTTQGTSGGGSVSRVSKRLAGTVTNTGMVETGFNAAASTGLHEPGDNELVEFRVFPSLGVVEYYLNGRLNYTRTGIDASTASTWGGIYGFSTANGPLANIDDVVARTLSNRLTVANFPQEFYASEYTGNATSATDFTGANVALSGTYLTSGTIPTALQYRVISTNAAYLAPSYATAPTYTVVQDWADCTDETFTSGNWTANARLPVGGPFYVEVRMRNDTSVTAQTANDTTVGGMGLIYGQSNAAFAVQSGITNRLFVPDLADTAADSAIISSSRANYVRNVYTAARAAAGIISAGLGIPFAVNGGGVGSQPAVALNPSNTNGAKFTDPIDGGTDSPWNLLKGKLADNGKTDLGKAAFMAYIQGEAEIDGTATFTPTTDYLAPVNEIISGFRSELAMSPTAYFYMTATGRVLTTTDAARDAKANLVRETQLGFHDPANNVIFAGSLAGIQMNDGFHYNPATQWGLEEIGKRIGLSVLFHQFGIGTHDGRGPRLLSAERANEVIDLPITAPGATAFGAFNGTAPATAASATALTGYQVSADDFANLLTISSTQLVEKTPGQWVVRITLSANPGGPVKVRSFYGKQPDITSWVYGTYTGFSRIALEPLYVPLTTTT